jgi:serine protease Do
VIAINAETGATHEAFPDGPEQGKGPDGFELISVGSGFFISPDGYAVTNSHIVENADTAEIRTSDNKPYSARVIGKDSLSDLALIRVEGRQRLRLRQTLRSVAASGRLGACYWQFVRAGGSVMAGIVSARERSLDAGSSEDFLQIDAPINKGDSGGPSFNTQGEVVGVNSMILSPGGRLGARRFRCSCRYDKDGDSPAQGQGQRHARMDRRRGSIGHP